MEHKHTLPMHAHLPATRWRSCLGNAEQQCQTQARAQHKPKAKNKDLPHLQVGHLDEHARELPLLALGAEVAEGEVEHEELRAEELQQDAARKALPQLRERHNHLDARHLHAAHDLC